MNSRPEVGAWVLDPAASSVGFRAKAFLWMKVTGRFERYDSSITVGPSTAESSVSVVVHADSVTTGNNKRDEHLRSATAFAVADFPTIEFSSTAISETSDGVELVGQLRVRDVSLPLTLRAVRVAGGDTPRYTAQAVVSPKDFGITRRGTGKPVTMMIDAVLRRA